MIRCCSDLRAQLGEDLWAIVQELDTGLAGVTTLTTLPSRWRSRAAFRLDLLDGRVVKARRFDSVTEAERVERLLRLLDRRCFPKALALRGAALLTEWAHGAPLSTTADGAPSGARHGAAAMHCRTLPVGLLRDARSAEAGREASSTAGHELVVGRALGSESSPSVGHRPGARAPGAPWAGARRLRAENMVEAWTAGFASSTTRRSPSVPVTTTWPAPGIDGP